MKSTSIPFLSLAAVLAVSPAVAETYYLNADDTTNSGSTSFNSAGHWSSGKAPAKGNDYRAEGHTVRTPNQGNAYTFGGDSLTLQSIMAEDGVTVKTWAGLTCKHKGGEEKPLTIDNFILENGRCSISDTWSSTSPEKFICGNITVNKGYFGFIGTAETGDRRMTVKSALHGTGAIVVELKESQSRVTFTGDNSDFSGRLYVDHDGVNNTANGGGTFQIRTPASWLADRPEADAEGVTINAGGILDFDFADALTTGAKRGFTINAKVATFSVKDGGTVTVNGPIVSAKGFKKTNPGTLVLSGDNAGLTSAAAVTVSAGTLKLASPTAAGSASVTFASESTLAIDPTAGVVALASKPTGLVNLAIEAEKVANPKAVDLFSYPTPASGDLVLEGIAVTTQLPAEVKTDKMKLEATADPETGLTTVSYVMPSSDVPTIEAALTGLTATKAIYTVTVGYVDEELTDEMSVTACYGATDGGKDASAWGDHISEVKTPGVSTVEILLTPGSETFVAFCAQKGAGEIVWTAPVVVTPPVVDLSADGTVLVEGPKGEITLTLTRPAASAELPLTVALSYTGLTTAFGEDALPATVTFPAGETSVMVSLNRTDDEVLSEEGTLAVALAPSETSDYAIAEGAGEVSLRVLDDESLKGAVCLVADLAELPEGAAARGRCVTSLDEAFFLTGFTSEKTVYVYPETVSLSGNVNVPQRVAVVGVPGRDGVLPLLDMDASCVMANAENSSMSSLRIVSQRTTGTPIVLKPGASMTDVTFADWVAGATNAGFKNVLEMNGDGVRLTNCSFVNCKSSNGYGIVYCSGTGKKVIEDCKFFQCRVNSDKAGGTIYTENTYLSSTDLFIERVRVEECYARAGVLRQDSGNVHVKNCFFCANDGGTGGWILMITNNAFTLELVQTTIVDSIGKALNFGKKSKGVVTNSLFWNNSSVDIQIGTEGASATIKNTCYREAAEGNADGNIAVNPLLKRDGTLSEKSPCINAGLPLSWTAEDVDLAGNPRVKGAGVDMGCFEYIPKGFAVIVR